MRAVVSDSRLLLDTKLATCDGQPANFENWQDLGIRSQVAAAKPKQDFKTDIYQFQRNHSREDDKITLAFTPVVTTL